MFNLDLIVYNSINNAIESWSTSYGLFEFLKFAVITSISATTISEFFKIKRGDRGAYKQKR